MPTSNLSFPIPLESGFSVVSWKPLRAGKSMLGLLSLELPSGLVLKSSALHHNGEGELWIAMPSRQYMDKNGTTRWESLIDFAGRGARRDFQAQAVAVVEAYFQEEGIVL